MYTLEREKGEGSLFFLWPLLSADHGCKKAQEKYVCPVINLPHAVLVQIRVARYINFFRENLDIFFTRRRVLQLSPFLNCLILLQL